MFVCSSEIIYLIYITEIYSLMLNHGIIEAQIEAQIDVSSVESQKGAANIQRCSVENQAGAITVHTVNGDRTLLVLSETSVNSDSALLALS